ncbi:MAG: hypothetical protein ACYCOX_18695 [Acidobacteriaceae bacterium]
MLDNYTNEQIFRAVRTIQKRNAFRAQVQLMALATAALPVGLWTHGPLSVALTVICLGTIGRTILIESRL